MHRLPFLGKLILLRGNYNFWCKSDHFWGVNSDFLCYFHPKIAFVKLVKTASEEGVKQTLLTPLQLQAHLCQLTGCPGCPESCAT